MSGFEKISQILLGREARKMTFVDKGRHNGRDGKALILLPPGMAAAPPAILMIWRPDAAELIGESLPPVAVTGHAPVPVEVPP